MAQCSACKQQLPPDAVFCPLCGQPAPARAPAAGPAAAGGAAAGVRVAAAVTASRPAAVVGTLSGLDTIPGVPPPPPPPPDLREGDVFHGRYTIERPLGAGAMGVVYAALDQVTGEKVALKLINPALADRPTARERFVREGLMARNVRHPNVVSMYDVGDAGGQIYLVMQYLGGESLRKWLRRSLQEARDISFDEARGIIRAVLEGLSAAHAAGVVHRDLKPENVMLTGDPHAGDCGLKILDFGIARAVGAASHVTTTSSSTGTPLYMAPEQKTAADTVGPAADLYAVTAMLYELLLGVAPEGRWALPSRERPDLPPGIDAIIETGLANRPRSRYQSAQEYIKALDAVGRPVVRAPEPPERVQPPPPEPPKAPPPPPREPPKAPGERFDWLKARSPAWALWDRLSKTQRLWVGMLGLLAFLTVLVVVAIYSALPAVVGPGGGGTGGPGVGGGSTGGSQVGGGPGPETGGGGKGSETGGGTGGTIVEPPPPVNLIGRWFDELTGTGVVVTISDLGQQGNQVGGPIYNTLGYQVGTFSGQVQGHYLEYTWVAVDGGSGTGRGQLRADGVHLDVETTDNNTGARARHTMHKNHMPPL